MNGLSICRITFHFSNLQNIEYISRMFIVVQQQLRYYIVALQDALTYVTATLTSVTYVDPQLMQVKTLIFRTSMNNLLISCNSHCKVKIKHVTELCVSFHVSYSAYITLAFQFSCVTGSLCASLLHWNVFLTSMQDVSINILYSIYLPTSCVLRMSTFNVRQN